MKRAVWTAALLAAAACVEPTTPGRGARFSYADTVAGQPIVFHWAPDDLPVRYYAQATGFFPALVARKLVEWEGQFLYGEFRAVMVSDPAQADVIIEFAGLPPVPTEPDTTSLAFTCTGVTSPVLTSGNDSLVLPLRVELDWSSGPASTAWACIERVTAHELGHTLGLFSRTHAGAQAGDLMFSPPMVYHSGARDRATVEVLYHATRTVVPDR